jgi:hypothetical protein
VRQLFEILDDPRFVKGGRNKRSTPSRQTQPSRKSSNSKSKNDDHMSFMEGLPDFSSEEEDDRGETAAPVKKSDSSASLTGRRGEGAKRVEPAGIRNDRSAAGRKGDSGSHGFGSSARSGAHGESASNKRRRGGSDSSDGEDMGRRSTRRREHSRSPEPQGNVAAGNTGRGGHSYGGHGRGGMRSRDSMYESVYPKDNNNHNTGQHQRGNEFGSMVAGWPGNRVGGEDYNPENAIVPELLQRQQQVQRPGMQMPGMMQQQQMGGGGAQGLQNFPGANNSGQQAFPPFAMPNPNAFAQLLATAGINPMNPQEVRMFLRSQSQKEQLMRKNMGMTPQQMHGGAMNAGGMAAGAMSGHMVSNSMGVFPQPAVPRPELPVGQMAQRIDSMIAAHRVNGAALVQQGMTLPQRPEGMGLTQAGMRPPAPFPPGHKGDSKGLAHAPDFQDWAQRRDWANSNSGEVQAALPGHHMAASAAGRPPEDASKLGMEEQRPAWFNKDNRNRHMGGRTGGFKRGAMGDGGQSHNQGDWKAVSDAIVLRNIPGHLAEKKTVSFMRVVLFYFSWYFHEHVLQDKAVILQGYCVLLAYLCDGSDTCVRVL